MALRIRNERAEHLAREIARMTGKNLTSSIIEALEEKLEGARRIGGGGLDDIMAISKRCSALPDLDSRSPEQILGYDEYGVNPHGDRYLRRYRRSAR